MSNLERRLENWGRVMRGGGGGTGQCGSAEGNYRPERGLYSLEERREPRVLVDTKDAAIVEAAWVRVAPPGSPPDRRRMKNILRLHFVRRCPWDFIARRQGIMPHKECFDAALDEAVQEIGRLLEPAREAA